MPEPSDFVPRAKYLGTPKFDSHTSDLAKMTAAWAANAGKQAAHQPGDQPVGLVVAGLQNLIQAQQVFGGMQPGIPQNQVTGGGSESHFGSGNVQTLAQLNQMSLHHATQRDGGLAADSIATRGSLALSSMSQTNRSIPPFAQKGTRTLHTRANGSTFSVFAPSLSGPTSSEGLESGPHLMEVGHYVEKDPTYPQSTPEGRCGGFVRVTFDSSFEFPVLKSFEKMFPDASFFLKMTQEEGLAWVKERRGNIDDYVAVMQAAIKSKKLWDRLFQEWKDAVTAALLDEFPDPDDILSAECLTRPCTQSGMECHRVGNSSFTWSVSANDDEQYDHEVDAPNPYPLPFSRRDQYWYWATIHVFIEGECWCEV